jgi:hypothetical protein
LGLIFVIIICEPDKNPQQLLVRITSNFDR